jgi:dCMP deaminase
MVTEPTPVARPDFDEYFMTIAMAVRMRANCLGSKVGAVLVLGNRIISTGYNGTPAGMQNCEDGGCERCANREDYGAGKGYDLCICVHAEQNALLSAARFGIGVDGSVLYTTLRPCFTCLKQLLQAGVNQVVYLHDWEHPDMTENPSLKKQYDDLEALFRRRHGRIRRLDLEDPENG